MALTYTVRPVARSISRLAPRLFDVLVATLIFTVLT